MTFEYRDADGGHLSVTPLPGVPYVLVRTDPEGCAVPADLVPDTVAGIRDAARTASGQQPEHTCPDGEPCPGHDAPAVGQPAEAQATNEARPPREEWRIELLDVDGWMPSGLVRPDRELAAQYLAGRRKQRPDATFRLVRETTTWTVEDER